MFKKEVISGRQLRGLIFIFISATATLYMPTFVTKHAEQNAWLSVLIGSAVGIAVVLVISALSDRFPEFTFVEYVEKIIGKWPGRILVFLYILFFMHMTSIITREITSTIKQTFLPGTSLIIITIVLFMAVSYSVKCGLEVITRANILNIISIYIALFAVLFLLWKDMDIKQLTPILSKGMMPVLRDSVSPAGWFGEVLSVAFIAPFINKHGDLRKNALVGVIWAGFTLAIIVCISIATYGQKLTSILTYPTLETVTYINVSDYIIKIEIIFLIPWLISNFIKLGFFYYITVLIISRWLKLENGETIILPVGLVIAVLSITIFEGNVDLIEFLEKIWGFYALIPEFVIPLILLLISAVRGKENKSEEKN